MECFLIGNRTKVRLFAMSTVISAVALVVVIYALNAAAVANELSVGDAL